MLLRRRTFGALVGAVSLGRSGVALLLGAPAGQADAESLHRLPRDCDGLTQRLRTGRIEVSGGSVDRSAATARGLVYVSFRETRDVLLDFERYGELLPLSAVRVLSRSATRAELYVESTSGPGYWAHLTVRNRTEPNGSYVIEAHKSDGSVNTLTATWELREIAGGAWTLVSFRLTIDPGTFYPESLVQDASEDLARGAVGNLRHQARQRRLALAHR